MNTLIRSKITFVTAIAMATVLQVTAHAQQGSYQQNSQYQQGYQQTAGLRSALPAYRGYQVQQMQQPASWYGYQQQAAAPAPRRTSSNAARPAAPSKTAQKPNHRPTGRVSAPRTSDRRAPQNNSGWMTNFDAAWQKAYRQGRPLVVLFVHHGCPVCDQMDQNLAVPGAMDTLASAIKVRVEFTDNPGVVNRFGVKLTPTFLVLSPSGAEAYREVGALSPQRLRQIQPAIESLVTEAPPEPARKKSRKYTDTLIQADDQPTSQSIASL